MNSALPNRFFKRLIKATGRKVFVILDNLRVHHSKPVKRWLAERRKAIKVFYWPSYSPELDPDEYLNGDLKRSVHGQTPARNAAEMRRKTMACLRSIQKRPDHGRYYSHHPNVKYAA